MQNKFATSVKHAMEDRKTSEEVKEKGGESHIKSSEFDLDRVGALDAQVAKLEKLIAELKAVKDDRLLGRQKTEAIKEVHPYGP